MFAMISRSGVASVWRDGWLMDWSRGIVGMRVWLWKGGGGGCGRSVAVSV